MAITKKPISAKQATSAAQAPLGGQMAEALQKFIDAAPDGARTRRTATASSVKLSLRMGQEELAGLDQAAQRQGLTRSAFIKRAVLQQQEATLDGTRPRESGAQANGETPADASLRLRRHLVSSLSAHLNRLQLSQAQAAVLCGVTQPRISALLRGEAIGLDALVSMASAAGLQVDLRVLAEV